MMKAEIDVLELQVVTETDPEMADFVNPEGHIWGFVYHARVIFPHGSTLVHFKGFQKLEQAERLADKVRGEVERYGTGCLSLNYWSYGDPIYGSQAYDEDQILESLA